MSAPVDTAMLIGHERVLINALWTGLSDGLQIVPEIFLAPNKKIVEVTLSLPQSKRHLLAVQDALLARGKRELESVGGQSCLTDIQCATVSRDIARYSFECVMDAWRARKEAQILKDGAAGKISADEVRAKLDEIRKPVEPEKSWDDALNESVVTSLELYALELVPRKKLLGDWFCEGDCGFIFAFRGVGKTWYALAMGQALATGGKLGDYQAPEPVKVLYIDSEMPPDLMRERSIGLGTSENFQIINHDVLFERTGKILNIADPGIQNAITKRCVEAGIKVLFIDNLSTAAFGLKENEADSWEKMLPWLLDLRRKKIAVVIIHHAGRSGEMRGTTKREDSVFWIIALDDMKKSADDKRGVRFISHFTKPSRNCQEELPAYEWHFVTESDGTVTIAHKPAQSLDVFRSVIESGVTRCEEIAEAMKLRPFQVSRLAKKAIDAKWLKKSGRNYALVEGK